MILARKKFVLTYKQTVLGPAWLIIHPLLSSIMHMIVFGYVVGVSTEGVPKLLFYLCSNTIWMLFSYCVQNNATTFTANAYLFGKVYFPRLTVPISNVLVGLLRFAVQMILVAVVLAWYGAHGAAAPCWGWFWILPVLLVQICLMGCAVGILLSSLTTKYRDLSILVSFGIQLWMYASPVVYPVTQLPEGSRLRFLLELNPVTAPVELFRKALLGEGTADMSGWLYSLVFTAVLLIVGMLVFNHVEKDFMDTV